MFQNMRYAPFLKMYENLLSSMSDVEYDVIYYNRDRSLGEIQDSHHIALPWHGKGTLAAPKIEKMANFVFYARDARKLLSKNKYDFVIVLTSFPAVLLANYLTNYYKGRYLIDIRDYTQEKFKPYFELESKAFSNAAIVLSSVNHTAAMSCTATMGLHYALNYTIFDAMVTSVFSPDSTNTCYGNSLVYARFHSGISSNFLRFKMCKGVNA